MRTPECGHPERKHKAHGLCGPCYDRGLEALPLEPPQCEVCGSQKVRIIRFQLMHKARVAGRMTTRGAGGISLCARCWRLARDRSRRQKSRLGA